MTTQKKKGGVKHKHAIKTARKHRISTAGKILPPLDVRTNKQLGEFKRRIKKGPLTIVLVYADWCGHCHTMMPHFDTASKSPERSIQSVKINEQMLTNVNSFVNKSVNKSAKPINVEGYPSIMLIDTKGNKVTDVPTTRDTDVMTSLMNKSGNLAKEAGLNSSKPEEVVNSIIKNNSVSINTNIENKNNTKNSLLAEVGVEESGLASPKNFDVGEDELKGSLAPTAPINQLNNKSSSPKKSINTYASIAPSPTTGFSSEYENKPNRSTNSQRNTDTSIEKEAKLVTSLSAPLSPPLNDDTDIIEPSGIPESKFNKSISNSLEPAEKISGGGCGCGSAPTMRYGGSLMGSLSRTAYTLAPAAALLATATTVMRSKTRKQKRGNKRTHRNRR